MLVQFFGWSKTVQGFLIASLERGLSADRIRALAKRISCDFQEAQFHPPVFSRNADGDIVVIMTFIAPDYFDVEACDEALNCWKEVSIADIYPYVRAMFASEIPGPIE